MGTDVSKRDLLILDLGKYQPAVVPTPGASRVSDDLPLGLVQTFGAKRVVFGYASQFAQEVVGIYVVRPGSSHGLSNVC